MVGVGLCASGAFNHRSNVNTTLGSQERPIRFEESILIISFNSKLLNPVQCYIRASQLYDKETFPNYLIHVPLWVVLLSLIAQVVYMFIQMAINLRTILSYLALNYKHNYQITTS